MIVYLIYITSLSYHFILISSKEFELELKEQEAQDVRDFHSDLNLKKRESLGFRLEQARQGTHVSTG